MMPSDGPLAPCAICGKPVKALFVYCVRCLFSELRRLDPEGEWEKQKALAQHLGLTAEQHGDAPTG
jgi:hypothetical protein